MVETLIRNPEFEQNPHTEIERKFIPVFPEKLTEFHEIARPIEQFYLSHPSEEFNLRLRETFDEDGQLRYGAALKDRGKITDAGLTRLEVEVEISPELYHYYRNDMPTVRKLRAHVNNGVEIDFYDDGHVQLESENPIAWTGFTDRYGDAFVDMTGDRIVDNEWRAHMKYRQEHDGHEALAPSPELDSDEIVRDILACCQASSPVFVKLCGRSGSGKSTVVREIQEKLANYQLASDVVSTDDYHRGTKWLREYNGGQEWTEWDAEIVYDTAAMAENLTCLQNGETIPRRAIDWSEAEPIKNGKIQPVPVIIIEGIYAGAKDFDSLSALTYDMPTPLATCIGRRLLRDLRERPQFANPERSLKYILEQAEPAWREQSV